jgi:predicted MPP superfamily phosphohydrolase
MPNSTAHRPGLARARARRAARVVTALAGLLAVWAAWVEPRRFVLRRRTLELDGWPPELDGLRVALLSDLHAGGPHVGLQRVRRVAARVQRARPDLALLLGDFVDFEVRGGGPLAPADVVAALAPLRPRLGCVAVLGNHDWRHGGARVREALLDHGVRVLENEACELGGVWLAGVADLREREPDVDAALAGVPDGAPVIALLHDPDIFPRIPPRVPLSVAGHTHGGQVVLPFVRHPFVPSRYGDRYAYGLVREDGRLLYVTGGVGQAGFPVRLRRPPEAVVLTLRGTGRGPDRRRRSGRRTASSDPSPGRAPGGRSGGA